MVLSLQGIQHRQFAERVGGHRAGLRREHPLQLPKQREDSMGLFGHLFIRDHTIFHDLPERRPLRHVFVQQQRSRLGIEPGLTHERASSFTAGMVDGLVVCPQLLQNFQFVRTAAPQVGHFGHPCFSSACTMCWNCSVWHQRVISRARTQRNGWSMFTTATPCRNLSHCDSWSLSYASACLRYRSRLTFPVIDFDPPASRIIVSTTDWLPFMTTAAARSADSSLRRTQWSSPSWTGIDSAASGPK